MLPNTLDPVLATDELDRRPSRPPDLAGENEALRELMTVYGARPEAVLTRLVEIVMERCGGTGAGLSVLERGSDGEDRLHWQATAGAFVPMRGTRAARSISPGDLVIARRETGLLVRPAREYAIMEDPDRVVYEELITPFLEEGEVMGTLWVATHDPARQFDAEDRRRLESLALFAAMAWRRHRTEETARREGAALLAQVETERAKLYALVKDAPAFVALLHGPDLTFTYVNEAFYALVGYRPIVGLPFAEALPEVAEQGFTAPIRRVMESGGPCLLNEACVTLQVRRDAPPVERFLNLAYGPARDPGGAIDGVLVHGVDVTEEVRSRRAMQRLNAELEAKVAERTAELQNAVAEAEAFNYSISHDLRSPLRAMAMTASVLLEEAGPELSQAHREQLVRQNESAMRMGRLIDELLRLSRLARVAVNREPFDLTAKVRAAFRELEVHGRANGCRLEAAEGLAATGDPVLVRTVLDNLLGNACKFSPGGGTIRVFSEDGAFVVADEGIGFDMAFAAKLFLPFERLVSEREFEGTGIGLANVERIVRRHGGRVWAESEPGRGATFRFTLGAD